MAERQVYEYLEPLEGRMIVTKPRAVGTAELKKTESGLYIPKQADATRREYGFVCKVLKAAPDLETRFPPGTGLLLAEYAGLPIYSDAGDADQAWIACEGDVLAKVDDTYWSEVIGNE